MTKHKAKKTGDGNYEYRGFDIQRNAWNGSSWSFWGTVPAPVLVRASGTMPTLRGCKKEIDRLLEN